MKRIQRMEMRMEKPVFMCCAILLLCAFTACSNQALENQGEEDLEVSTDPIESFGYNAGVENDKDELDSKASSTNESDNSTKIIVFLSEEDVKNMPDEYLIKLSQNAIDTSDYVEDAMAIDDFGVALLTESNETYRIEENAIEKKAAEEGKTVQEVACEYMQYLLDCWKVERPGEKTGRDVVDPEMLYCGEDEYCVVYSLRYIDESTLYENNVLITHEIPRAYRCVFLKQIESVQGENYATLYGDLSTEYVKNSLDIMLQVASDSAIIYRSIREEEANYVYSIYATTCTYGDYGVFDTANLLYGEYTVTKDTGRIELTKSEKVRCVDIPGTDTDSNVVEEGEYPQ